VDGKQMCIILIIGFINPNNYFANLWLKLCSLWSFVSDTEQLELKSALNLDLNLISSYTNVHNDRN